MSLTFLVLMSVMLAAAGIAALIAMAFGRLLFLEEPQKPPTLPDALSDHYREISSWPKRPPLR